MIKPSAGDFVGLAVTLVIVALSGWGITSLWGYVPASHPWLMGTVATLLAIGAIKSVWDSVGSEGISQGCSWILVLLVIGGFIILVLAAARYLFSH